MIDGAPLLHAVAAASATLAESGSPRLDAELLLAHALGVRRLDLYLQADRALRPVEATAFRGLLRARQNGAPVAYLVGRKDFFGLELEVTPDVLIPRPETERLVEAALEWARRLSLRRVADVGTGSGAIALALAQNLPAVRVDALDCSPAALAVAERNARRLGLSDQIRFLLGDLTDPLSTPVEMLLANLPYVADPDWEDLPPAVRTHEPALALRGGADGLDVYRGLLRKAGAGPLTPGGLLLLEMDPRQREALVALVRTHLRSATIEVVPDLTGRDRVLIART